MATNGDASLGKFAVMVFFVLSGFLLARSWIAAPQLGAFLWKRALRIGPGLAAVVLVSVLLLGPAVSAAPIGAYFGASETWRYLANLGLYSGHQSLPGVFDGVPFPGVVNGPLWTLKFEVLCYATLAAAGAMRVLTAPLILALLAMLYGATALSGDGDRAGAAYYLYQYTDLARPFFTGVLFALMGRQIALTPRAAALSLAGLVIAAPAGLLSTVFPVFGGYLVLWLAFAPLGPIARAGQFGDFSYGLYLWGWPVQQVVQSLVQPTHWAHNAALALPLAFGLAIASWTFVERPSLAFKSLPRAARTSSQPVN